MTLNIPRGTQDEVIDRMIEALKGYEEDHSGAQIDIYRQNPVSIRIRIIDPDFQNLEKSQRHDLAWRYLERLPDEIQSDISMLLLLAPDETSRSFANFEFNDPIPSRL